MARNPILQSDPSAPSSGRLTRRRPLRQGTSPWQESLGAHVPYAPLLGDVHTDVVIVGAGISGALMAHALTAEGHAVVLLDRRAPMMGSTVASTALLQYELDVPLIHLADRIGWEAAQGAWRSSREGLRGLMALVKRAGIRCALDPCRSLYLAGSILSANEMREEQAARMCAGLSCRYLDHDALATRFELDRDAAIESPVAATVNPVQLTAGLLRRAVARGARIFSPVDARDLQRAGSAIAVTTDVGHTVVAQTVVFCTGYELPAPVQLGDAQIKSTWAFASEPGAQLPHWLHNTVIWEASHPYLYVRGTRDGRLMAGGADEASAERHQDVAVMREKSAQLAAQVRALMPTARFRVSHRWAGAFGESSKGLPIIGAVPGWPGCYCVAGLGGNGITFSQVAAEIVADAIAGRAPVNAALFQPL